MLRPRRTDTEIAVIPRPTRTPERQALADALAERDRRKAVVEARKAHLDSLWERRAPLYAEMERIEHQLANTDDLRAERFAALARGEEPADLPTEASLRARLADLEAEAHAAKAEAKVVEGEIERLGEPMRWAEMDVAAAVKAVLASEPVLSELAVEYRAISFRKEALERALIGAFGEDQGGLPRSHFPADEHCPDLLPCPWQAAAARLRDDPDARFPTLAQGLALIESTPDRAA